jgi:hypothetical protein
MHLTSTLVLFLTFSTSLVTAAPASAAYSSVSVASDAEGALLERRESNDCNKKCKKRVKNVMDAEISASYACEYLDAKECKKAKKKFNRKNKKCGNACQYAKLQAERSLVQLISSTAKQQADENQPTFGKIQASSFDQRVSTFSPTRSPFLQEDSAASAETR